MIRHLAIVLAALPAASAAPAVLAATAPPAEIVIPGENIFPESLTSATDDSVISGSIGAKTIFRAKPGAAAFAPWIQPGTAGLSNIFGVLADNKSNTLWVCSNTLGPPDAAPATPATVYAFDLKTGAAKGHYPFATDKGFCNDIAVGADGTAYVSDTDNMEVERLKKGAKALELWAGGGAFGPKGGVLDGIAVLGKTVYVNTLATSKVFSIPIESGGKAGTPAEVKLDRGISRPDGMRSFGKTDLLIVEGGTGGRLSRITIKGNTGTVKTLKEGYPDGAVAVTVVGTTAYVLEGQLGAMRPRPDAPAQAPKPFKATAVEVGKP